MPRWCRIESGLLSWSSERRSFGPDDAHNNVHEHPRHSSAVEASSWTYCSSERGWAPAKSCSSRSRPFSIGSNSESFVSGNSGKTLQNIPILLCSWSSSDLLQHCCIPRLYYTKHKRQITDCIASTPRRRIFYRILGRTNPWSWKDLCTDDIYRGGHAELRSWSGIGDSPFRRSPHCRTLCTFSDSTLPYGKLTRWSVEVAGFHEQVTLGRRSQTLVLVVHAGWEGWRTP
mmetsp:Transcript_10986/g.21913  ORF Transcript_10986/g.21913 Transcript_10986/m.21913 type:complete len:230 (-) Transcript_10986:907-1596(-)